MPPYPSCVEALSLGILMRDGVSDKHGKEVCTLQYKNKMWEGYIDSDHGTYITFNSHNTYTHLPCDLLISAKDYAFKGLGTSFDSTQKMLFFDITSLNLMHLSMQFGTFWCTTSNSIRTVKKIFVHAKWCKSTKFFDCPKTVLLMKKFDNKCFSRHHVSSFVPLCQMYHQFIQVRGTQSLEIQNLLKSDS